jgi:hypothetical protein
MLRIDPEMFTRPRPSRKEYASSSMSSAGVNDTHSACLSQSRSPSCPAYWKHEWGAFIPACSAGVPAREFGQRLAARGNGDGEFNTGRDAPGTRSRDGRGTGENQRSLIMELARVIERVGTVLELRRIARAYVIDDRNLTDEEIKAAIVKTAPQYYHLENVQTAVQEFYNGRD